MIYFQVSSKNDRFVTDNIKCEVKLPFDINYGADLNEMMGMTHSSNLDVTSMSSNRTRRKPSKAKSTLMRKMTMKVTINDALSDVTSNKSAKGKKLSKKLSSVAQDGAMRNTIGKDLGDPKKAKAAEKKGEQPLNLKVDPDRPQEKNGVTQDAIEMSIEKKRARVNIDAIHKAQVSAIVSS